MSCTCSCFIKFFSFALYLEKRLKKIKKYTEVQKLRAVFFFPLTSRDNDIISRLTIYYFFEITR